MGIFGAKMMIFQWLSLVRPQERREPKRAGKRAGTSGGLFTMKWIIQVKDSKRSFSNQLRQSVTHVPGLYLQNVQPGATANGYRRRW